MSDTAWIQTLFDIVRDNLTLAEVHVATARESHPSEVQHTMSVFYAIERTRNAKNCIAEIALHLSPASRKRKRKGASHAR